MDLLKIGELLTNPVQAISSAKKEKNLNTTLKILFFEWVFITLAVFITSNYLNLAIIGAQTSLLVFLVGITGVLIYGFLIKLILTILGGRGKYFEGLTSIVYAIFPLSVGLLLSSVFIAIHPIGIAFSIIILLIYVVMSIATFYKGVKDLFNVDLITAWIGISILVVGTVVAFNMLFLLTTENFQQLLLTSKLG
jgi:hypothetical protein